MLCFTRVNKYIYNYNIFHLSALCILRTYCALTPSAKYASIKYDVCEILPSKCFNWNCAVSCVAELCSSESIPEVEIISLLEEQIPRYKLRADTLTQFGGE